SFLTCIAKQINSNDLGEGEVASPSLSYQDPGPGPNRCRPLPRDLSAAVVGHETPSSSVSRPPAMVLAAQRRRRHAPLGGGGAAASAHRSEKESWPLSVVEEE